MIRVKLVGNTLVVTVGNETYSNNTLTKDEQVKILLQINGFDKDPTPEKLEEYRAIIAEAMKAKIPEPNPIEAKQKEERKEQIKTYTETVSKLEGLDPELFEVLNATLYLKGIPLSIPSVLAMRITAAEGAEREALINFWYRCAKNENAQSRQDLFQFIEKYKFQVLSSGLFVAYRNVLIKTKYMAKYQFVSELVEQIKTWRRSLKYYTVLKYNEDEYFWVENSKPNYEKRLQVAKDAVIEKGGTNIIELGNCGEIYHNMLYNDNIFTDAYTKSFDISLGKVVSQARKDCDTNINQDCSNGLHVGTPSFLQNGYLGNQPIYVLIDPEDVIAVPKYNTNKMRVCKYYPVGYTKYDESGKLVETIVNEAEVDYCTIKIEEVMKAVKSKTNFEEMKTNRLVPIELTYEVYKNMGNVLEHITDIVKNRKRKVR